VEATGHRQLDAGRESQGYRSKAHYTVHPAIRDGFLKSLDAETTRQNHDAVRNLLLISLVGMPGTGTRYPADRRVLNQLEEIVYHTVEANRVQNAWGVYRSQIGGYQNLGWRPGEYERGARLCRAFEVSSVRERGSLVEKLGRIDLANWSYQYGLYLMGLGQLERTQFYLEQAHTLFSEECQLKGSSRGRRMLAELLLKKGHLLSAARNAQEAVESAQKAWNTRAMRDSHLTLALISVFMGNLKAASKEFDEAASKEVDATPQLDDAVESVKRTEAGLSSGARVLLLTRTGKNVQALQVLEQALANAQAQFGDRSQYIPRCHLSVLSVISLYFAISDRFWKLSRC
jgi:tetratricopeptide (TPR) repeat protein